MTDKEVLQHLRRRVQRRYRRFVKRGETHAPRHAYDCARCKFSWCCYELCHCSIPGEPTKERRAEVDRLLATWRRTRML